ncbi:hypothetical protein L195_g031974 [Trifolium pratense]|uniref:FAS1 domain-containing protein n=1 Tax=Trifolium pratense TaxID=57577 RepID=A0A2K3LBW5_TRIPR|nr:hypothetical protein L195_g031974 [Trifolium pratense]
MKQNPNTLLLLLLLLTVTLTTATSSTEPLFSTAAQTLTNSNFLSMSLTLRLASSSLPSTTSATIFVPSDTAFRRHGPLPLSLLQYHIIPSKIPLHYLTSLPISTPLPTLLPNSSLIITTSSLSHHHHHHHHHFSINNVTVSTTPLFENPSLLILSLHDFFNSSSLYLPEPESLRRILRSNNCSLTAVFLENLLPELTVGAKITVFAPPDEAVRNVAILKKHVVLGLIRWRDLIRFPDDARLKTLFDGFDIRVSVFPRRRLLNGVNIIVPDMYRDEFVVVHRVGGLLDSGTELVK